MITENRTGGISNLVQVWPSKNNLKKRTCKGRLKHSLRKNSIEKLMQKELG